MPSVDEADAGSRGISKYPMSVQLGNVTGIRNRALNSRTADGSSWLQKLAAVLNSAARIVVAKKNANQRAFARAGHALMSALD